MFQYLNDAGANVFTCADLDERQLLVSSQSKH